MRLDKIFENHILDKALVSRINKLYLQFNNKKINNPFHKWAKDPDSVTKKIYKQPTSTMKRSLISLTISSVQFSRSVMSNPLQPHELQHARPPCPSPTPGVHSNSCPSSQSVMPSSHLILCHPLFLLPPIPPSIRVFSNESTLHMRWPKY